MPTDNRVLADTHTLLGGVRQRSPVSTAGSTLAHASAVLLSPLTLWEVAMLVQRGRVSLDQPTLQWSHDYGLFPDGPDVT